MTMPPANSQLAVVSGTPVPCNRYSNPVKGAPVLGLSNEPRASAYFRSEDRSRKLVPGGGPNDQIDQPKAPRRATYL